MDMKKKTLSWQLYKVKVPVGQVGDYKIERFKISKTEPAFSRLREASGHERDFIEPGTYTKLTHNGQTIMSDTPQEILDLVDFKLAVNEHGGRVLIHGLGLGIAVKMAILAEKVTEITAIEISPEVIELVGGYWRNYALKRCKDFYIVEGDVFKMKYPMKTKYQVVWHDIWDRICGDDYPQQRRLHMKYGKLSYWQGSWCGRQRSEQAGLRYRPDYMINYRLKHKSKISSADRKRKKKQSN